MRILHVISTFVPAYNYGGPVTSSYYLCKALKELGNSVTVLTTDAYDESGRYCPKESPTYIDGLEVYYFKNLSNKLALKNFFCAPSFYFYLRKHITDYDIIHLHDYRTMQAVFTYLLAIKYNVPYVIQNRGSVLPIMGNEKMKVLFDKIIGDKILKNAKKFYALSNAEKKQYILMGIDNESIEIIPNGINLPEVDPRISYGDFREKYSLGKEKILVLYLGRLHKRKGISQLIEAFYLLSKEIKNLHLVIVGPDDGYLKRIEHDIIFFNLEKNVTYTGPLYDTDKNKAYLDADLLVYPGYLEAFGKVPFEALLFRTPVIVSDDSGCGEIIINSNCGLTFKQNDISDLKEKMKKLILDKTFSEKCINLGIEFVKNELSWNKIAEVTLKSYNCILNPETVR